MRPHALAATLVLLAALPRLAAAAPAGEDAAPPSPGLAAAADPLDAVAWLAGSWRGERGDEALEETWFPPADGTMVGLFRWLKGGELYLYELMSFEAAEGGLVLKIKHFGPGLVGWEEKAEWKLFDLVGVEDGKAVFAERGDEVEHTRVTYRPEGESAMVATFEEVRGGEPMVLTFRYRRE